MKNLSIVTAMGVGLLAALFPAHAGVVLNTADSGAGSLRQVIADAVVGETITFDAAVHGQTIVLTSGELTIDKTLTITGPGADLLTISGNNASRIFHINLTSWGATTGSMTFNVSGLTLVDGVTAGSGGAIYARTPGSGNFWSYFTNLNVSDCVIRNCTAAVGGGGINFARYGTMTMTRCTLQGNTAVEGGDSTPTTTPPSSAAPCRTMSPPSPAGGYTSSSMAP